ncbi:MAG: hypothetical protein WBD87_08850 [Candidatus Acidiferrales bacterium]
MQSIENLTAENAAPEFGAVTGYAPDDRAELFDLYRSVIPSGTLGDFEADVTEDREMFWTILRSKDGPIIAAMLVTVRGYVIPFVPPKEASSPWAVSAVVKLAEEAMQALRGRGITQFNMAVSRELDALAAQLERCSLVGKDLYSVRALQFDGDGKVARAN